MSAVPVTQKDAAAVDQDGRESMKTRYEGKNTNISRPII